MKRIVPILLLICICFTGCSLKKVVELEGREQVEAFVAEAKTWQSGRYMLTNLATGETDQVFSFMNNADGTQSYLYERISDGTLYAEYSDGKEIYFTAEKDGESADGEGAEDNVLYTVENPHPYSTGDLLFYVNLYASGSTSATDGEGNVTYTYVYDTEKINKALGTSLSSFETTYTFDKDGGFLYFTQSNSDGENSYAYMIEVIDVNGITEMEKPDRVMNN
ncbi:MAG: hypothetical protein IJ035_08815 [Oscillospiraceae bacterium]|nr:hypothetical protein [Oscillospiraceae bacterium]